MTGDQRRLEAGISTVETVLLTPLLVGFVVLVAALGLLVNARGDINGVARDAARAGALERTHAAAVAAAHAAATGGLDNLCESTSLVSVGGPAAFQPGGLFTIQVTCEVDIGFAGGLLGGGSTTVTSRATAPLDTLRRAG